MTDIGSFPVAHTLCGFCNFQISNGIMRNPKQVIRVKQKNFFDLNALALLSFSRSRHLIGTGDKHRPIEHPGVGGWGWHSQKNWVGVCGPLPKTFTFMTKICDFHYPIYDLTKNLIPYL